MIRYAIYPGDSDRQGLCLYFFRGMQYIQRDFKEDTYLDIQTDGELRIKGTIQLPNQNRNLEEWIVDLRFTSQNQESYYSTRSFKITKGAKLVNKSNRYEVMAIRSIKPDDIVEMDDLVLKPAINEGNKTQLKAVFEYQRPDGSWRQASIQVALSPVCTQINPVKLESIDSDRIDAYKWKLINANQREVKMILRDERANPRAITVPSSRKDKDGIYEFYTNKKSGNYLDLIYAAFPDYHLSSKYVNQEIPQQSHNMDAESAFPEN